jgi:Fibronectin type III domain
MKFYSVHPPLNRVALISILCITISACGGGTSSDLTEEDAARREQASATATWTTVASEGQSFTLATPKRVRYGAGSTWVSKYLSGTVYCGTSTFGTDPLPGRAKECRTRTLASTSTAALAWTAPTGTDVSGYRVYYGTTSRSYAQERGNGVSAGNTTTFTVNELQTGQVYYFAVTSVNSAGGESSFSNEATKLIE